MAWARCFDGTLINLDQAEHVKIVQGSSEELHTVEAKFSSGFKAILLDVPHGVALAAMERIYGHTVGYGETRLDFAPGGHFFRSRIPERP